MSYHTPFLLLLLFPREIIFRIRLTGTYTIFTLVSETISVNSLKQFEGR